MRLAPRTVWLALLFILAGVPGPAGSARAGAPATAELENLRLTMPAIAVYYAPYLVAIEKGYFAAQGLRVEITDAGGGVATPALMSGTIDVSTSPAAALTAIMRGAPLKVVYTMADRCNYQLWSTEPELRTLKDLKGKSVGILSRGDTFEIAMRLTLLQAGLPQDWVGYTALGFGDQARAAAIASGSLPAVIAARSDLQPLLGTPAMARGHLIVDMNESIRWPYTGVVVADSLIKSHPDRLRGFLRATVEGVRYVRAFKAETIALLQKYDPHATAKGFAVDYDDSVAAMTPDGIAGDDMIRKDLMVRAETLGIAPDKVRPNDQVYDYGPLREAIQAVDSSGWKPTP